MRISSSYPKSCEGCTYLAKDTKTCDFFLRTGHCRPCPSGDGCTVKREMPNDMNKGDKIIRELHKGGKSNQEIAEATGFGVLFVAEWCKQNGFKPHDKKELTL